MKIRYHHLITLGLLAVSTSAIAMPPINFIFGLGAGAGNLQVERNTNTTIVSAITNEPVSTFGGNYNDSGNGGALGGLFGLSTAFNNVFSVALEGTVNYLSSNADVSITNPGGFVGQNVNFDQELKMSYGISLVPTVTINQNNNLAIFGRVGYTLGEFEFDNTGTTTFDQGYNGNFNKSLDGLTLGLGLSVPLKQDISLQLEADHTQFDSISKTSYDLFTTNTTTTTYKPDINIAMLSLVFSLPTSIG